MLVFVCLAFALTGCGRSCEDIEEDIRDISRDIQRDPESAWDRAEELEKLKDEAIDIGCLASQ